MIAAPPAPRSGGDALPRGDVGEHRGDSGEVRAHRVLGLVAVALGDGGDDRLVLGERVDRAPGCEHGAELEAHALGAQAPADVDGRVMARDLEDPAVEDAVAGRHLEQLAAVVQPAHLAHELTELGRLGVGAAQGGIARGQGLERGPSFEDLDRLVDGDAPDLRAPIALADHEPLVAEPHERGADRPAAEPETFGEILLDEPLAGRKVGAHDRPVKGLIGVAFAHCAELYIRYEDILTEIVDDLVIVRAVSQRVHPVPSDRARETVRGGFDPHVHIAPDFARRRITDLELADRCREVGLAGFGLKSHYAPTVERAAVVSAARPGIQAFGTLTLNHAVGGLNATAVEVAAREGARIVWLPTVSAPGEYAEVEQADPDGNVPVWVRFELELRAAGARPHPVPVLDDARRPLPDLLDVLEVIAHHDIVLATGHLSQTEIVAVVEAAVDVGVGTIVVTHPEFPSQSIPPSVQRELAERGALMERAFTTPYTGKCSWEQVFEATRAVGPARTVWGSDLGQVFNPPVEDGLAIMADAFLAAGFSEEEVRVMAVENTRRLAGHA